VTIPVWLLELACRLKAEKRAGSEDRRLAGRHLVMASETTSSRTRSAFATAARDQGAFSFLEPSKMRRFRVDATVVLKTGNSRLKLLNGLPGERDRTSALGRAIFTELALLGADVADGVFRSSRSRVAAQVENRLHRTNQV
jgi:ornithine carbamoyltransferase